MLKPMPGVPSPSTPGEIPTPEAQPEIKLAPPLEEDNSFSIEKFIKFGELSKEVEVLGILVRFKTLTDADKSKALNSLSAKDLEGNLMFKTETISRLMLAFSIEKMGDELYDTPEKKRILFDQFGTAQMLVLRAVQSSYEELLNDQLNILSKGLKKN